MLPRYEHDRGRILLPSAVRRRGRDLVGQLVRCVEERGLPRQARIRTRKVPCSLQVPRQVHEEGKVSRLLSRFRELEGLKLQGCSTPATSTWSVVVGRCNITLRS